MHSITFDVSRVFDKILYFSRNIRRQGGEEKVLVFFENFLSRQFLHFTVLRAAKVVRKLYKIDENIFPKKPENETSIAQKCQQCHPEKSIYGPKRTATSVRYNLYRFSPSRKMYK